MGGSDGPRSSEPLQLRGGSRDEDPRTGAGPGAHEGALPQVTGTRAQGGSQGTTEGLDRGCPSPGTPAAARRDKEGPAPCAEGIQPAPTLPLDSFSAPGLRGWVPAAQDTDTLGPSALPSLQRCLNGAHRTPVLT